MNCDFERLFKANFPVTEIVNTRKHKEESRILRKKREILDRAKGFKTILRGDTAAIAGDMTRWKMIVANSNIVMRADHRFIRTPDPYDWLRIREEILQRADDVTDSWGPNVLGVHIRRTDNEWSKKRSPTSGFCEKIDAAIDEEESIEIFLTSDSEDEVRYLQNRYGRRIKQFVKTSLDRNLAIAAEEALIDFVSLSRTSRIIGSFWSSFSMEAAELGKVSIEVIDTGEK